MNNNMNNMGMTNANMSLNNKIPDKDQKVNRNQMPSETKAEMTVRYNNSMNPSRNSYVDMNTHRNARRQRWEDHDADNVYRMEELYKQYNTPDEIFETILRHEAKGCAFHDKMMDLFGFLNLDGFKKMHEYQYIAETMELRQTKCYILDNLGMLIDYEIDTTGLGFIPEQWYDDMRHDISPKTRRDYIMYAFKLYKDWEYETRNLFSFAANELMDLNRVADFKEVTEKVEDDNEEIKHLEKLCLKLDAADWDMSYILGMQEELEMKYSKKLEKLFEEKCKEDKVRRHHRVRQDEQEYGRYDRSNSRRYRY